MRALLAAGADPDTRKTPPGAARSNDGLATPLIYAAECNVLPVVQLLLESDAQVNLCRADGCAAIYFAAQNGHITVLETLIAANADINQMASDGTTPLHAAAMWGETAAANVLLAAGATTTAAPVPPLLVACAHGYPNVVRSLLAADADVTARMDGSDQHLMGNGGNTALMLAVGAPEHSLLIVQMLQCYGADPTAVNGGGETAETIAQWGEEPNAVVLEWLRAVDGYTAVEVCARVGDHRQMRALLRAGGNFGPRLALFSGLCPLTAALCRDARKPWSPKHHLLHPPATRAAITMLLHVEVWYKHNIRCPAWATKTWLPRECWLIVMSYFRR
jgi:ankyrin repeat protein